MSDNNQAKWLMIRKYVLIIAVCIGAVPGWAQQTFRLWQESPGQTEKDIPTLTMYAPDSSKTTKTAIIICPGGSYRGLAKHEGEDYALFLASQGI